MQKIGAYSYSNLTRDSYTNKRKDENIKSKFSDYTLLNEETFVQKNITKSLNISYGGMQNKILSNTKNDVVSSTINRDVSYDYITNTDNLGKMVHGSKEGTLSYDVFDESKGCNVQRLAETISYPVDFDPENPIMIIRGEDEKGYYEAYVDIKKINPTNASAMEIKAVNGYFKGETGAPFLPANFANDDLSPYDTTNETARFNIVDAYKIAVSMDVFAKQGIEYNINDAYNFFRGLWGENFGL